MFEKEDFNASTPVPKRQANPDPDLLELSSADPVEDLSRELAEHQERLLALRRQQEEVETRKRELEELSKRRAELTTGQKSMREKLTRAITLLERAEYDTQRELETIRTTRQTFKEHLSDVESIDPKEWEPDEVDEQLTRSLSLIDHAQASYSQSKLKLEAFSGRLSATDPVEDDDEEDEFDGPSFFELVRRGFAFSLPLLVLLTTIAFLLIYLLFRS